MNYDEIDTQNDTEIQSGASALLYQANVSESDTSAYYPLKVRTGHHKRLSGFRRKPFASVLGSTERRHRIASHQCVIMFMLVCKWSQCAIECNHQANQCDICTFSFHISASHTELRTVSLLLILSRKVLFSMFVLRRFMVMCHHRHVIPSLLISPLGHTWANSFFFSFVCRHFGSIPTSYHQIQTVHLSWATFQRF